LAEIAAAFGIEKGTAQNQLKSVFGKTATRRQAELVRLILTGPANFGKLEPGVDRSGRIAMEKARYAS
ncbi:MAG: hypothetical protein V3S29_03115, partial [bacterium]